MNLLIFPNQLFEHHPGLKLKPKQIVLIEDSLFFGDHQYPMAFHKQKIWLHRATMKRFEQLLQSKGWKTLYLEYNPQPNSLQAHLHDVCSSQTSPSNKFVVAEPDDFILRKRLDRICATLNVTLETTPNPNFLNQPVENNEYRKSKKRWFMADFYKFQRKRFEILVDGDRPVGGKWSFDEDNRKKIPKNLLNEIPTVPQLKRDEVDSEARQYVGKKFNTNPGSVEDLYYASSHVDAKGWLNHFLHQKLSRFGDFEDAIVHDESWLWHSVLTPALNIGLLTPDQVIKETLAFAENNNVPLNSLEGFLRQIIGWREFIRATYNHHSVQMRTTNHWNHHRRMPTQFYNGNTGIPPIDDAIQRILRTGYCHHIERLMVLGGFMFLCEIHPDDIYRWFMEMFVDSYDWVMVPNVYAMSQHADGGLITTKPYFSGSAYIRKMSPL